MTQFMWAATTDVLWPSSRFRKKEANLDTPRRQRPNVKETLAMMNSNEGTKTVSRKSKTRNQEKTESKAEEATETQAKAKAKRSDAKKAEARVASAASTAAADGKSIKKDHAAASVGTVASEVQEAKGNEDKILALIQEGNQPRRMRKKKIREISKKIKKCLRDNKRSKRKEKIKRSWKKSKVQRTFPVSNQ